MGITLRIIGAIMAIVGLFFGAIALFGADSFSLTNLFYMVPLVFGFGNIAIGVGLLLLKRWAILGAIGFSIIVILVNFLTPYGWGSGRAALFSLLFYGAMAILSGMYLNGKKA